MNAFKTTLQTGLILLFLAFLPERSGGQIYLTGLLQQGADSQTGHSLDSPIFNTLPSYQSSGYFAHIYLTAPNAGYDAAFLNSGNNGLDPSISLNLTPGTYQFYFFTISFFDNSPGPQNDPGTYGLNLFFNGENTHPGIAAYSPENIATATPVQAGQGTLSLNGDGSNEVPAPGTLTYIADGLSVTLTSYGYGRPGVFGGAPVDRVSNVYSQPDGYTDAVGYFALTVSAVPEPSSAAILVVAVSLFLIFKMKTAQKPAAA